MDLIKELYNKIEEGKLWDGKVSLKRNEFLKAAGTIDTSLYYLVSGNVKVSVTNLNKEYVLRFGFQNNFIAALDSFISGKPSALCIQAVKKVDLKFISKATHSSLISQNADNQILWNNILEQMIAQQLEREKDLLMPTPKERFQKVHERNPYIFQEIPSKYIASYLRMTPETLSRLKKS